MLFEWRGMCRVDILRSLDVTLYWCDRRGARFIMGVRTEVVMLGRKFRGRGKSRRHVMDFTSF